MSHASRVRNRLSCRRFCNNEVRLQLHAVAYNLGNFMRTLALPGEVEHWSLTTLRKKLIKIGAKVVNLGRYVTFQLAEENDGESITMREIRRKLCSLYNGKGLQFPRNWGLSGEYRLTVEVLHVCVEGMNV